MSMQRHTGRAAGCPSGARGRSCARGPMGDAIDDLRNFFTLTPSSQVTALVGQVNRFGPSAPAAYQFATAPVVDTGKIDPTLALVALTIYQRRATDAYTQIQDAGSLAAITAANQGFSDPVGFVTAHLSDVLTAISGFGDAVGLPPAAVAASTPPPLDSTTILVAAAAGIALWWMMR